MCHCQLLQIMFSHTIEMHVHDPGALYQLPMDRSMCHCQWCKSRPRPAACVRVNACKSRPHPPATDRSPSKYSVHLDADTYVQSHNRAIYACTRPDKDCMHRVLFTLCRWIAACVIVMVQIMPTSSSHRSVTKCMQRAP